MTAKWKRIIAIWFIGLFLCNFIIMMLATKGETAISLASALVLTVSFAIIVKIVLDLSK